MDSFEALAKAIYEGRNGKGCRAWGSLPQSHRNPYLTDAHAAVKAMPLDPPLTCPHIDAAVASGELSPEVIAELAEIRDINSQLRYGTWALKARLDAVKAK
jgi:hypothetical protein